MTSTTTKPETLEWGTGPDWKPATLGLADGRTVVLAATAWHVACRAAAWAGWDPAGARFGQARRCPLTPGGTLEEKDARSLGKHLDKALDRFARLSVAERQGAQLVLPYRHRGPDLPGELWLTPPASPDALPAPPMAPAPGTWLNPFTELNGDLRAKAQHADPEVSVDVQSLRRLATILRDGGPVTYTGGAPIGWRRFPFVGPPRRRIRFLGTEAYATLQWIKEQRYPGDVVTVALAEAERLVSIGAAEYVDEAVAA